MESQPLPKTAKVMSFLIRVWFLHCWFDWFSWFVVGLVRSIVSLNRVQHFSQQKNATGPMAMKGLGFGFSHEKPQDPKEECVGPAPWEKRKSGTLKSRDGHNAPQ